MPITIKQNLMKYKSDRLHQYVGINSVAERATADQIEDIEAAGADTIAEVNAAIAAGQTAIDGIEAQKNQMISAIASVAGAGTDKTLSTPDVAADAEAVGIVKNTLNASNSSIYDKWEQGSYDSLTGNEYAGSGNTRIRNKLLFGVSTGVERIQSDNDYRFLLFAWDKSGNFVGSYHEDGTFAANSSNLNWITSFNCNLFPNYVFKAALRYQTGASNIDPSAGSNIHYQYCDDTLSKRYKSADAKSTGLNFDLTNGKPFTGTFTGSGNQWYFFSFSIGVDYIFKNTSESSGISAGTVSRIGISGSNNTIENIGTGTILKNTQVTFTPSQKASYLWVYCNGAGSFELSLKNNLKSLKNSITTNAAGISANAQDISNLSNTVSQNATTANNGIQKNATGITNQFSHTATKTVESSGNSWLEYDIKTGHIYTIKNIGVVNITLLKTANSSGDIDTIISDPLIPGASVQFVAENDAIYIHAYFAGAGSFSVVEETTVKNNYECISKVDTFAIKTHGELESEIIAIAGNGKDFPLNPEWERGGIYLTGNNKGADWPNDYAIRTKYIHFTTEGTIVGSALSGNNSCTCIVYTSGKVYSYDISIPTTNREIKISAGQFVRIFVNGNSTYPTSPDTPENYISLSILNTLYDDLPGYYKTHLDSKIGDILEASAYIRGVTFPFITDVHLLYNSMNSGKLIREIDKRTNAVPFVVFGGDVPMAIDTQENVISYANKWNKYMSIWGKHKTIQVHGNHDYMCKLTGTDTLWFAPLSTVFEYVQQNDYFLIDRPANALYGAVDIKNQKIKIIIADNYDAGYDFAHDEWDGGALMSDEQLKWIAQTVLDSTDYHILFVSHVPTLASISVAAEATALKPFDDLIKAARNGMSYTVDGETFNFANWTGKVIGELSGHMHKDAHGTDDNVLYIGTTCDCYVDDDPNVTRTQGTTSEQAFDIVCIDATNMNIKLVRIGGGSNRTYSYRYGD